jgi:septin family protein
VPVQDLKELTNMVHYENFRASVLERNGGAQPAQAHMIA